MATTQEKTTPNCCIEATRTVNNKASEILRDWKLPESDPSRDPIRKRESLATMVRSVESLPDPSTNTLTSTKGINNCF